MERGKRSYRRGNWAKVENYLKGRGRGRDSRPQLTPAQLEERSLVLERAWHYFRECADSSRTAQTYAAQRGLDVKHLEIGFNDGDLLFALPDLRKDARRFGLVKQMRGNKSPAFGSNSLVFALRRGDGSIGGLYFRALHNRHGKHLYLKQRTGLYPHWPAPDTRRLLIAESVIDAATVLMHPFLSRDFTVLAIYGTSGFNAEHEQAIKQLRQPEEIVLALDGDKAGKLGMTKIAQRIKLLQPQVLLSDANLPHNDDPNGVAVSYGIDVLHKLIQTRTPLETSRKPLYRSAG